MELQGRAWTWEQMESFFYMTNQEKADVVWECRIRELAQPNILQNLLDLYGEGIKATTKDVTVMYLAGWFGYLCGGMHFLSSDGWEATAENIKLQLYKNQRGTKLISFVVDSENLVEKGDRKWVEEFYEKMMKPTFLQMQATSTNNTLLQMWYQATHSLYWISDRMKHSCLSERYVWQYEKTLEMFKEVTPSSCMGVMTEKHPYAKKLIFIDNPWDLNDPMPLKPSCCLAYQTEGGHLCFTCPRMKKSERLEKFNKVLAEHSTMS
ncbi:(2Fe-2S)-binding protein [Sutcliffiella horikoshii]|uniref:(2Fe-2S)-binding protein n=1 Tax=Sutcliffiella horikoshii TaxID=79883 RepID=UPI001CBAB28C|nr:(2Fe-2S)-binding protein [Sutcliffiella horikoshii]UAL48923.1 (2Fe-2S)-binding protein [Sutcliffiella horikoshii]